MSTPRNVLIHTHGIHGVDYSSMTPGQLPLVEKEAASTGTGVVPSVFLAREYLDTFEQVVREYSAFRSEFPSVLGFSIEGPVLGRLGGVPPAGIWSPGAQEWRRIAALGEHGLSYVVLAPDGGDLDDPVSDGTTYRDVVDLLYQNGVRIAFGHFRHNDPELSAKRVNSAIEYVHETYGNQEDLLLSDHLFNDMPRNFTHVWRTPEARGRRERELSEFLSADWENSDLDELLGPVPAALVKSARKGLVTPFMNFDGEHVDIAICERTLSYLGPNRIIGITDDTPNSVLAGEDLHRRDGGGLWYRNDGIVAAGSGHLGHQRANLASIGHGTEVFDRLFGSTPARALRPIERRSEVAR